ncbi:MAG TPA: 1-acyl-sn-glycerol-3-phosphate acyltransferase [Burkholderiaceae bacterium]
MTRSHPLIPSAMPRLSQRLAVRLLGVFGWHVHFAPLPGPHGVFVVYPHTSNWDFVVGMLARIAVGMQIRWLGKEALFSGPFFGFWFGPLMRRLGGEPVVRTSSTGAIERLAQRMHAAESFWLALAPEGTRSYKPYWRSGFYHIALTAEVPVALAFIDYGHKEIGFVEHMRLTGDVETDLARIRKAYADCRGLHPELAAPIVFKDG